MAVNFEGKTFQLVNNSNHGTSEVETRFFYSQIGSIVTAEFAGGSVVKGFIMANYRPGFLDMVYQLITTDNELKLGKALAKIQMEGNKIQLDLDWEWLTGSDIAGTSTYLE